MFLLRNKKNYQLSGALAINAFCGLSLRCSVAAVLIRRSNVFLWRNKKKCHRIITKAHPSGAVIDLRYC